jgi:hypothetical protein
MLKGYKDFYELAPQQLAQAVHQGADIQRRPGCYVYRTEAGALVGIYLAADIERGSSGGQAGRVYNLLALELEPVEQL